jgi:hypothetical protein
VYVYKGTFTKSGGIITGNYANKGKEVYVDSGKKKRDNGAGQEDNLDSRKSGAAGGWEN